MNKIATSHIALAAGALVVLILLGGLFIHHPSGMLTDLSAKILTPVSAAFHRMISFTGVFAGRRDLAQENIRLTERLGAAQGQEARLAALTDENAFLKASLGIKDRLAHPPVEGGVFSYLAEGGVRQLVINRGSQDGVVAGSIVITAQGALVGMVQQVFVRHATVRSLKDASMEVTARVMNSEVTGLVRVDAAGDLILDLVQKSEKVTEKQTVITSGNDQFPAGLVIGMVRSVDNDSATLFKMVRLDPAAAGGSGMVLILQP